jgi:hypothetical protein
MGPGLIDRAAGLGHDCAGPALDLPAEVGAAPDINAQAAVVVRANVLPNRSRVVTLEGRAPELIGLGPRDLAPELLCRIYVGALVNVDPKDQLVSIDPCRVQKLQEKPDQRGVAVNKADPVTSAVGLVFLTFAPVGDRPGDDDLPVGDGTDFRRRGGPGRLPLRLADGPFGRPVPADSFCGSFTALLVAQAWRARQIPDP